MTDIQDSEEFVAFLDKIGRRWYQFGWRSPNILYRRLRNKHRPIFRIKMSWQRVRRGYSDSDAWSMSYHLAQMIDGMVGKLIEWSTGYPFILTAEEWRQILEEIQEGMRAALRAEETGSFTEEDEEKFNLAIAHMQKWWLALWD